MPTSRKLRLVLVICCVSVSGCALHSITSATPDGTGAAGQSFHENQVSYFGAEGLNSDGTAYVAKECRSAGLAEVRLKRNFGQTLVTLLTLGIVSPATFEFQCKKTGAPAPQPNQQGDDF